MAKPVYFIKFGTKSKRVSSEIADFDALQQLFRAKFDKVISALPFGGEGAEFSFNINDPTHGERYELEDIDDLYDGARIEVDLDNESDLKEKEKVDAEAKKAEADAAAEAKKAEAEAAADARKAEQEAEAEAAAAATAAAMAAVAREQKEKKKADAEKRKAAAKQKASAKKKSAVVVVTVDKPVPMTDDEPAAGGKSPGGQKRKAPGAASTPKGGNNNAAAGAGTPSQQAKKKTKKQDGSAAPSPNVNGAKKSDKKKDSGRDRRDRDRDNRRSSQGGRDHDRGGRRGGDSAKKNGGFGGGRSARAEPPEDLSDTIDFLANGYPAHIRGLSFSHTENDILEFFSGIDIMHNGVFILKNPKDITRATGDGFVAFATEDDLERGIRKDREHLGSRYIEVRRSTRAKMKEAMSRAKEQFRIVNLPLRPGTFLVKMHGLPYGCKNDEVHAFFESLAEQPVGVHRILDTNSKPTRIAFAEFLTENGFREALKLDRQYVGSRYVNLAEAKADDMRKAMGLFEGTKSRCLRLWGVPHDAADDDISKFFNDRVNIIPMRIHRKRGGLEAFVEFATEHDTRTALTLNKSHMGSKWIDMRAVDYDRMASIVGLPPVRDDHRGGGPMRGGNARGGGGGMRDERGMRGGPPPPMDVRGGGGPMRGPRESRFGPPAGGARGPPAPAALGGGGPLHHHAAAAARAPAAAVGFGGVNAVPLGGGGGGPAAAMMHQPQQAAAAAAAAAAMAAQQPMIHDVRGPGFAANTPFGQSPSPLSGASSAGVGQRYPAIQPSVGGGPRASAQNPEYRSSHRGGPGGAGGRSPPRIHDVRDRRGSMGGGGSGMNGRGRNDRGGNSRWGNNDRRGSHGGGPTLMQIDGVPYDATRRDIMDFFRGFGVIDHTVEVLQEKGRSIGTAIARFQTSRDATNALQSLDRNYIGKRYVKLKLLPGK